MKQIVFSLLGRMFIFYGNKTSTQFLNFTPTLICSDDLQTNILASRFLCPRQTGAWGLEEGFEEVVLYQKSPMPRVLWRPRAAVSRLEGAAVACGRPVCKRPLLSRWVLGLTFVSPCFVLLPCDV